MARVIKIGQQVSCYVAVDAYYSGYAGRPRVVFHPGMVGVVAVITPKVRYTSKFAILDEPQKYDSKEDFVVVDFESSITGKKERVGLNFVNVVSMKGVKRGN